MKISVEYVKKGVPLVMVSIVGDFYSSILPLFYEYHHKIDKHIIIYDDYKNDMLYAQKIIEGTKKFIQKSGLSIQTKSIVIDEDSITAIEKAIEFIKKESPKSENLLINITDGLAHIGILLSNVFLKKGAQVLSYDRYDNEYNILTSKTLTRSKITQCIPIKDHFLLKNIDILKCESQESANKNEHDIAIFFEKYEADRKLYLVSEESNRTINTTSTGFLYEQYIFNLIKRLNVDDIMLGVKIEDKRGENATLVNEYDILIMKDNHLHMIECKYLKLIDTTALIYKLDSVKESLDEDANIFIVNNSDTYNEETLEQAHAVTPHKRALAKRITIRGAIQSNTQKFIEEVDRVLELHTDKIKSISQSHKQSDSLKAPKRKEMKGRINSTLAQKLHYSVDYFEKNTLLGLLNYKTNKKLPLKTIEQMSKKSYMRDFIREILTMLTSKQEYISMEELHTTFMEHIYGK